MIRWTTSSLMIAAGVVGGISLAGGKTVICTFRRAQVAVNRDSARLEGRRIRVQRKLRMPDAFELFTALSTMSFVRMQ